MKTPLWRWGSHLFCYHEQKNILVGKILTTLPQCATSGVRFSAGNSGVMSMKSRESVLRLKRFQVQEKARQVAQIETMISQFENMANDLDSQIAYEEKKAGIEDVNHFAYPTFAKAARLRRENLQTSVQDLHDQHAAAKLALAEVDEELKKAEKLEERDGKSAEPEAPSNYEQAGMIG